MEERTSFAAAAAGFEKSLSGNNSVGKQFKNCTLGLLPPFVLCREPGLGSQIDAGAHRGSTRPHLFP